MEASDLPVSSTDLHRARRPQRIPALRQGLRRVLRRRCHQEGTDGIGSPHHALFKLLSTLLPIAKTGSFPSSVLGIAI